VVADQTSSPSLLPAALCHSFFLLEPSKKHPVAIIVAIIVAAAAPAHSPSQPPSFG